MARAWVIDGRSIARKVKHATRSSGHQIKDCGANRECPNCHFRIDNSDVSYEWPGLPLGVKFEPTDAELIEHLAAKCGVGNSKPHMFIDEFIPTLEGEKGICYTHPENLPGAKNDGSSIHFFHKTINAYATGQRKRRKVHTEERATEEHVRWHKTGKTKPVMDNEIQKGCKKIMVLYKKSVKGSKPDKTKWVMHQYHLGTDEDEKEGEYVVSKVFYQQQKPTEKNDDNPIIEESDVFTLQTSPRTPNPNPPNPPRSGKSVLCDDVAEDCEIQLPVKEQEITEEAYYVAAAPDIQLEDGVGFPVWLAGESQTVENSDFCIDDSLLCKEILNPSSHQNNSGTNHVSNSGISANTNGVTRNDNAPCSIADLENLELDTPPDFQLSDLQFGSQDSIFDWIDRL